MSGIYYIPSGYSFLESLVKGLLEEQEKDPFRFSQMEVFLPTRRACLELKNALLREAKGQCLLLPKMIPLGDIEEEGENFLSLQDELSLLPVIPPFKRLGLLTKLVQEYTEKSKLPSSPALSLKLAKSLIKLMDQAAIENVPWERLFHLVPAEFAMHWQLTLDFLEIVTTHWPKILEEKGFCEPYVRHHQVVEALLSRWEKDPPSHSILAAGSTGTMPATARLLQAILTLPQGRVVLPGLDGSLSKEDLEGLTPCHPQYALVSFLKKVSLLPKEVPLWPGLEVPEEKSLARACLFREALKPSFSPHGTSPGKALEQLSLIPCSSPQEEALAIALLLRQQLEIPDQRIALITSDLKLAERVTGELQRWEIEIDRSSGDALDQTPSGVFLRLCADCAASPQSQVALLSFLKHPLFRMGRKPKDVRMDIRSFEKNNLRKGSLTVPSWLQEFNACMRPLREMQNVPFQEVLRAHLHLAETLSTDEEGGCLLWAGAKGKALQAFFEEVQEASDDFPSLSLDEYVLVLQEIFRGQCLRFRPQKHPRLAILGPLETRLFHADVMILGGLNEGNWPPEVGMDPWLNRLMQQEMGFSPPERRIGLSAHDFGQAFASPKVYLTRALKVDGTPTLASRWVERLEVYLKAWGLALPEERRILKWLSYVDHPEEMKEMSPPAPTPPVPSRPRRLSVTQVEAWMRDPYAFYARHVLSLLPLEVLNAEMGASDRGSVIHQVLDQFFKVSSPQDKPSLDLLLCIGKTVFEPFEDNSSVRLFWWPRFCHLARWFIEVEKGTRLQGTKTFTEVKGKLVLETPLGPFECIAKADRIDLLPDGRVRILDYKTGMPPSERDVSLGFSPQLSLEGAIALQGGFDNIEADQIESLQYWWLKGDSKGGIIKILADPQELSLKAHQGLERMIHVFENEETPYPARPFPEKGLRYNDYAHLSRLQEWGRL